MRLVHCGTGYSGIDPAGAGYFEAGPGETVEVSEAKGQQLLRDFPGEWTESAPPAGAAPRHTKPAKVAQQK